MVFWNKELLFCDINPTCYSISLKKEQYKRHLKDFKSRDSFSKTVEQTKLPHVVAERHSYMIKKAPAVDPMTQINKANNINIASKHMEENVGVKIDLIDGYLRISEYFE